MNTSHHRWLLEQLPKWESEGLLTTEASRTLRERHAADASQPGAAQIIMGSLGALLIGTGVITIIGFNWDDFSRLVRLVFAFLPLLLTQLFSLRVMLQGDAAAAWVRETAALLQALCTGACIALVSQIYNLGGEWPDFLFWWCLLSLPLVWVMKSSSVAIFYLIGIAEWSIHQVWGHQPWHASPMIYPLLLLGLFPFWPGWKLDRPLSTTLRWVMTISAICGLCAAAHHATRMHFAESWGHFEVTLWLWVLTSAMLALFPLPLSALDAESRQKPQIVLGFLHLLQFGVVATFLDMGSELAKAVREAWQVPWTWVLIALIAAFAVHAIFRRRWAVLSVASIAITPVLALVMGETAQAILPWLMTLHLSLIGITLIVLEFTGRRGAPRLGAALLCVLIIARMFESELSLLTKGLAFIVIGVAFLAFNICMSRLARQKQLPQP
jgi:uncharacterized membrane protein